jgi:hypothetical protein
MPWLVAAALGEVLLLNLTRSCALIRMQVERMCPKKGCCFLPGDVAHCPKCHAPATDPKTGRHIKQRTRSLAAGIQLRFTNASVAAQMRWHAEGRQAIEGRLTSIWGAPGAAGAARAPAAAALGVSQHVPSRPRRCPPVDRPSCPAAPDCRCNERHMPCFDPAVALLLPVVPC